MIHKVEICGVNTSKLPLLSKQEKQELFVKIKEGDEEARKEFINGNLRLVLSVIKRFNGRGENADDLFQVGCVGLIKSIDNFDITQGVQFSTYAVPSIRDLAYKAMQFKEKYVRENGKEPTLSEIAKELEVEEEEISMSLDAIQDPVSLQEPVFNDGQESIYIMDQVKDSKNTDEFWAENMTINQAMSRLNDKEKMIINKRFFEGRTQMEVASEIGISQAQVSRLEKSAITHLKKNYK